MFFPEQSLLCFTDEAFAVHVMVVRPFGYYLLLFSSNLYLCINAASQINSMLFHRWGTHEQAGKHYCRKALKLDPQSENVHGNL